MVHFNFTLSDVDAENLFDILNNARINCLDKALSEKKEHYIVAYTNQAEYIDSLKKKLKHNDK